MAKPNEPPTERRLFLVDGYAIIYRAFFAMVARPLTTSRGENTSAVFGVAKFLQRLLGVHQPEYLGWVHDSGLSFRHDEYPEYKATREKLTEELQADFDRGIERVEQLLTAYRIPIMALDGYEADDVIGTLAAKGANAGLNVVIVSGDKDFQQLVGPSIWLLNPGRGGPAAVDEQWVGRDNAADRLGVPPEQVTDYLALVGDSSDNVPGVKGIGEKTAVTLLQQYGSLEAILSHAGEIKQKRPREALEQFHESARLSKRLVTIHQDLNIPLDLDAMQRTTPDVARLRELLVELEFHDLARSIEVPTGSELPTSRVAQAANYRAVQSTEQLNQIVQHIRNRGRVAFDTETVLDPGVITTVDPLRSRLVGLSLAVAPGEAYYLPFRHRAGPEAPRDLLTGDAPPRSGKQYVTSKAPENLPPITAPACEPLRAMLADAGVKKIGQNAKYDLLVLETEGIPVNGISFDTMIASYVLDPGRRSHGLDALALEFLDHEMIPYEALAGKGKTAIGFDVVAVDKAVEYSCEDVDVTLRLAELFQERMVQNGVEPLFRKIEMPLLPVLAHMEAAGIAVDVNVFHRLRTEFDRERNRVEGEIYKAAGEEFNINSNAQLRRILFEKLELPILKKTATGPSTDASVLEQLAEAGHEIPRWIMEFRELTKLQSTYVETLPRLVNPETGRLHTSFNQTVAATGRLSSSDPNLQNIPVRTALGREIRRAFIPRSGWTMVTADYSQIELRLLGHLSRDPVFISTFRAGGDIHRETAALIFGIDPSAVTPEMRSRAKTINFATIYGQGAHALSQQLRISHTEAKEFIEQYFKRFTGVRAYLDSAVEDARTRGYSETLFGRRRYIPELKDRNFNIRAFGERTAQNTPIQGSAADLIKIAMINVDARLRREHRNSAMLLQVHDELIFEVPPDELPSLSQLVREEMEGAAHLEVPLVVDIGTGSNWLECKHT